VPIRFVNTHGMGDIANGLVIAALIISFLYIAGAIVEPLAIAGLLGFILAPVMRGLRRGGVPKAFAAIFCVGLTLSVIGVLGATLGLQGRQLALDLPTYETNLREKIKLLGNMPLLSGILNRASGTLRDLQEELSRTENRPLAEQAAEGPKPLPVEIHQPEPKGLEALSNIVRPLLSPLATTALVILFLLFILLQREDIRDRFLRLAGTDDLQRSTAALDDAASGSASSTLRSSSPYRGVVFLSHRAHSRQQRPLRLLLPQGRHRITLTHRTRRVPNQPGICLNLWHSCCRNTSNTPLWDIQYSMNSWKN
jgi:predicted PurR-regulated permease PerM